MTREKIKDVLCNHRDCLLDVDTKLQRKNNLLLLEISVSCPRCEECALFLGLPCGDDPHGATVSTDQRTARLAMKLPTLPREYTVDLLRGTIIPSGRKPKMQEIANINRGGEQ